MADFHVLETNPQKDVARIAIHVTVPAGNNAAGKSWSSAVLGHLGGTQSTKVPWLAATNPTEATAITNGSAYEFVESVQFNANDTNANKLSAMQAHVAARQAQILSRLQDTLRFWGYDGDVP